MMAAQQSSGVDNGPTTFEPDVRPRSSDAQRIRVALVDDDPYLRESLADIVTNLAGYTVVGAASTLSEGLDVLAGEPDVILLDLALPDGNGLTLIDAARRMDSPTKIIVITVFGDVRTVMRAIETGADGYLLKDSEPHEISRSIEIVLDGGAPISPAVAGHILARIRKPSAPAGEDPAEPLTAKETQVLEHLATGKSFKEVAVAEGISPHTVGDHVKAIYRKLSVHSRGEAVFKAIQHGIIRMDS